MEKHKSHILIDYTKCPPCSGLICVGVCPLGLFEVSKDGKPEIANIGSCTRCGVCANLCPTKAITINGDSQSEN